MGKGGILQSWFKNFTVMVFLQSFHAVFLAFIMEWISDIISTQNDAMSFANVNSMSDFLKQTEKITALDGIVPIIMIVSIMALIKMEKMVKDLFGLEDSKFLGGVKDNLTKSMAGMKSAADMAKRTAQPIKDYKQADSRRRAAAKGKIDSKAKIANIEGKALDSFDGKTDDEKRRNKAKQIEAAREELQKHEQEELKAKTDMKYAKKSAVTTTATTVGATAFGAGAAGNLADAAIVANITDAALDYGANKLNTRKVYGQAANSVNKRLKEVNDKLADTSGMSETEIEDLKIEQKVLVQTKYEFDTKISEKSERELVSDVRNAAKTSAVSLPMKAERDAWKNSRATKARGDYDYRKQVIKHGVEYKGSNVDDI